MAVSFYYLRLFCICVIIIANAYSKIFSLCMTCKVFKNSIILFLVFHEKWHIEWKSNFLTILGILLFLWIGIGLWLLFNFWCFYIDLQTKQIRQFLTKNLLKFIILESDWNLYPILFSYLLNFWKTSIFWKTLTIFPCI